MQKLQKIYELSEFLSIYHLRNGEGADDFSEKVGNMFENLKMRSPSISLDDLSVWEELLFSRILFYDKIRSSSAYVEHGEIEFASILCANTAEFPLKLGWFEVSEKFLRDAINRRENQRVTSIKIILPLLRLKAKDL